MKAKLFSLLAITFLFISCNNQPDCNDSDSIDLAKELIIQEMNENIGKSMTLFGVNIESNIAEFVNNYIEIKSIRVTGKEKELKKCDCATQIEFNLPEDFLEQIDKQSEKLDNFAANSVKNLFSSKLDYEYSLQLSEGEEKELFVEGFVPTEEIQEVFMAFTMLNKRFSEMNKDNSEKIAEKEQSSPKKINYKKGDKLIFNSIDNNGQNIYILNFIEDNKIELEYKYFDYSDKQTLTIENGIISDDTYVLEDSTFKAFNVESQEYDIYKLKK